MRLRSTTTTTTGATTWRVGPSGMAPLPWWRRVLSRRDRRSVRRVRQTASGRRRGREPAPGRRALAGPALCAATGICSRIAYETCVAAGVLGLFARASLSILSPAAPLSMVRVSSRADSGRRAGTEGPGRGFFCAGRHGEGQRLQGLRLLAASSGAGPDGPKRFNRHHHIDGRCHLDLFKMLGTLDPDVHRRTAGGRRATRPGPGGDPCRRVGQRQRRRAPHSRSSSARPNSWRHPARPGRYREPMDTALAGRLVVPEPARGRTALPDRRPWRRSGDSRRESVRTWRRWRCVGLLPSGCLSLFSAARLPLPWFVRIPRRFREARQTGGHGRC